MFSMVRSSEGQALTVSLPAEAGEEIAVPVATRRTWQALSVLRPEWIALGLVVLTGLGLRLYGLTSYGIWFDEGYHIALVKLPTIGSMLDAVLSNPPSDPLYVLVLRLWVDLFGHGDTAVRTLSVLIGAATLPAIYWLGRELGSRSAGLLGAALFAVSPYGVEFGQEAALYGLATLLTTLALAQGIHFLRTGRGGWLYLLLGVAAIYSHYVVAVILTLFVLFPFATRLHTVPTKRWLLLNLIIFAAWAPWLAASLVHWASSDLPRASLTHWATWQEMQDALVQFTSGTASVQRHDMLLQNAGLFIGGLLLVLALVLRREAGRFSRAIIAGATLIFVVPWVVSRFSGKWLFVSHFMLFLLPVLLVLLAWGVLYFALNMRAPLKWAVLACLAAWLGVQMVGLALYYRYPPHGADGLRELASALRSEPPGAGPVLVTPPVLSATLDQYYGRPTYGLPSDFDLRQVYIPYNPAAWNSQSLARLTSLVKGQKSFVLVYRSELDSGGSFLKTLQRTYRQTEHRSHIYADVYRFASEP